MNLGLRMIVLGVGTFIPAQSPLDQLLENWPFGTSLPFDYHPQLVRPILAVVVSPHAILN